MRTFPESVQLLDTPEPNAKPIKRMISISSENAKVKLALKDDLKLSLESLKSNSELK
jgi:hypothetical protein